MSVDKSKESKERLDTFFARAKALGEHYQEWTGSYPTLLHISPAILAKLSRIEGFYQREELKAQVTAHAPVIRYIDFTWGVVTIVEDWEEQFFHFDD